LELIEQMQSNPDGCPAHIISITALGFVRFFTVGNFDGGIPCLTCQIKDAVLAIDDPFDLTKQLPYKDDKANNCIYTYNTLIQNLSYFFSS